MDPGEIDNQDLALEARRLFVSAALTLHAARLLGGRIPAGDLPGLARRLGEEARDLERRHRLRFAPPYPGVTAGVETVGSGLRLVLACAAFEGEAPPGEAPLGEASLGEAPLGVAFTTLIPGRRPQVSVAPAGARIPDGWRALDDLS